ncbi:STY4528 family pathogenicity island replication protein [Mixta tenebrionis]|jgi:hypothetical protein|uniref:Uncharacterized protein n=2 Tax=Mixta TaxID=2100764 RepID=A0A6P1Q114_9GAMM|nr:MULTISPECIES: STY4528 family pathogenicity island replication protein [Mixta]QHM72656.1 hypothetical protein C7M51_02974 [Mixta intestinalis]TPW40883.1 helix-turn-helix domain-containing protein [Mixta tenebrionis]
MMPADSLIAHTLEKMNARLATKPLHEDGRIRSGLLYTGNVHDAIPRRLLLDTRLSPLDKLGWMMIRLYAQNNEGAVFPTYDELQLQLASPGKGKASRETVSRVLLMLRITGWLSLCKRVRDEYGRVRGNIYAQHDEPLTFRDAETFDPRFLDTVVDACRSKNKTISQTAREILEEIKSDPTMRHYRSHLSLLETRLGSPQDGRQMAARQAVREQSPETEPCLRQIKNGQKSPDSEAELSKKQRQDAQSSDSELPVKSAGYHKVRKPNHYVRSITQSVKKNTYVADGNLLPDILNSIVSAEDRMMLNGQLQALPEEQSRQILSSLKIMLDRRQVANPTGWLLAMMKKAREGQLNLNPGTAVAEDKPQPRPEQRPFVPACQPAGQPVTEQQARQYVSQLRARLKTVIKK